jgi:hypothetical protein
MSYYYHIYIYIYICVLILTTIIIYICTYYNTIILLSYIYVTYYHTIIIRVRAALVGYAKTESSARMYHTPESDPASSVAEEDLHIGSWIRHSNIRYCIRECGANYGSRLKAVPNYISLPVVAGCEAVIFPSVYPIQNGVNLVTGERCRYACITIIDTIIHHILTNYTNDAYTYDTLQVRNT